MHESETNYFLINWRQFDELMNKGKSLEGLKHVGATVWVQFQDPGIEMLVRLSWEMLHIYIENRNPTGLRIKLSVGE